MKSTLLKSTSKKVSVPNIEHYRDSSKIISFKKFDYQALKFPLPQDFQRFFRIYLSFFKLLFIIHTLKK